MSEDQAKEVLIKVAHLAQKGGLLTLEDAVTVANAIHILTKKDEQLPADK